MAVSDGGVSVEVSGGRNNVFTLRNKFELLAVPNERRGTVCGHSTPYPIETSTLGRKVNRGNSFSFGTKSRGDAIDGPSNFGIFPFIMREQRGRSSNRSLPDSGYDSYTLATPPRRMKHVHQSSGHISPCGSFSLSQPTKLSPAQSLSSLSSSPASPNPYMRNNSLSSSVLNLSIEPSHNVSNSPW